MNLTEKIMKEVIKYMRKPHQILAFPFIKENNQYLYGIFCRNNKKEIWQGIAGGVEDYDTTYKAACIREANKEAGLTDFSNVIELESICTIPVPNVTKEFLWGEDILLIYEHCFGIECKSKNIKLSNEHIKMEWLNYEEAIKKLKWDSNKNALWELNYKINNQKNLQSKTITNTSII